MLLVEREIGHAPFKGQQGTGNDLLVGRDTLAVFDVDLHLLKHLLQFVLLLGQVFPAGGGDNLGDQCLERIEFGRIERQMKYRVDFVLYFELLL